MSDLRAMLIEARGERRVGDMVQLRTSEVDALIEALREKPTEAAIAIAGFYETQADYVAAADKAIAEAKPVAVIKPRRSK